jgi:DNA repair exonuclease SbcCD ATPase subunit
MILEIDSVRFKNFFSFGSKIQEFRYEPGVNLIVGYDKDSAKSNGAGKSNLIDAPVFGLFGKTTKGIVKRNVINWKNKKKCEVHVDFKREGRAYTIERGLAPDFIRLYEDGKEIKQVSDKRDFQNEIERDVLGIDYDTFISLIHGNPNNSVSIFNTSKWAKRNFLENLFGLQTFSKITDLCTRKLSAISQQVASIQQTVHYNNKTVIDLNKQIEEFEGNIASLSDAGAEGLAEELREAELAAAEASPQVAELEEKMRRLEARTAKREAALTRTTQNIYAIEHKTKLLGSSEARFDEKKYEQLRQLIFEIEGKISEFDEQVLRDTESIISGDLKSLEADYYQLQGKLGGVPDCAHLEGMATCPTCRQEIDFDVVSGKIEEERSQIIAAQEEHRKRISALEGELGEARARLALFSELERNRAALDVLERDRMESERARKMALMKEKYLRVTEKLARVSDSLTEEISKDGRIAGYLDSKVSELRAVVSRPDEIRRDIERLEKITQGNEEQRRVLKGYISANRDKIKKLEKENEDLQAKKKKFNTMVDYLEFVKFICKDENVKQYAISNIVPYLNSQANNYLAEAGFGFYLKLDNWLAEEIKGPGISNCAFGNLSGGERAITDLAMKFAFHDVSRLQSTVFPDILLLDELLDSAIDSQSMEKIIQIIHNKQKSDGSKVYIISHRKEINELEATNIYQVVKENGFSTVEKCT